MLEFGGFRGTPVSAVTERIEQVNATIAAACARAGRSATMVQLVAVSKTQTTEAIQQAYAAGLRVFGENRVQEAQAKVSTLPADIDWHLVGHLQSNKANVASQIFSTIHSVDSVRLGQRLAARAVTVGHPIRVLLQVSLTAKASQSGFAADDLPQAVAALVTEEGLALDGLMMIAPQGSDPEEARPWFRRLAALHGELASAAGSHPWRHLSMGMTEDYAVAIEEGATLVRVGRAIFGERPT